MMGQRAVGRAPLAGSVLLVALLAALAAQAQEAVRGPDEPTGLQVAAALEDVLAEAIARSERSVVAVARFRSPPQLASTTRQNLELRINVFAQQQWNAMNPGAGSDPEPTDFAAGVVIDASGLILTNYHVLADDSQYQVMTIDRKPYPAKVKAADPRSDLAVLQVEASDLQPIRLGDGGAARKGQIVLALGNPYAIARDGQVSASWGIVSNLSRKAAPLAGTANAGKPTLHHHGTLIQTDAKLTFGSSGGALVNLRGEMIGLTTSLAAVSGYEQAAGYAIPVDETFHRVIEKLKRGEEVDYGFLGIQTSDMVATEQQAGRHGALVITVVDGTPAARAGIDTNDIITAVDGRPIHSADDLILNVGRLPAGSTTTLSVERDGQRAQVPVELAKFAVVGKKIVTQPGPDWRGLRVDYPTAITDFSVTFGWYDGRNSEGVAVTEVAEGSASARDGVRPGMLITHVGGKAVRTPKQFFAETAGKDGPLELRVVYQGAEQRLTVKAAG